MRTTISIPDRLFNQGEDLAKTIKLRRSDLYARAVEQFIRLHHDEEVTAALNRIYSVESYSLDPVLANLQFAVLQHDAL